MIQLNSQYANLGQSFSRQSLPAAVSQPQTLLWNETLAQQLGLDLATDQRAAYFSGQQLFNGSVPVAMAYAGHQFGQFNPQLGDGRAHLLGEILDSQGQTQEIQLKGSGQTPFSRNGDGLCGIKPAVREYLMSEAMHALGVPTTRCLAVVLTGQSVYRQTESAGAIVTRVASSHLRVGTFEYFAARRMHTEVNTLVDLAIDRHAPEIDKTSQTKYIKLLSHVIEKQIKLIAEWMRVGFIHGVMNTDNTLLSGDTIDYGPCAMLGVYDPATVFSSIDHQSRYAFGNQPHIALWNLARLAECFVPLIADEQQTAVKAVMPLIEGFESQYQQAFQTMMIRKLGFKQPSGASTALIQPLLDLMFKQQLDYTHTFVELQAKLAAEPQASNRSAFDVWVANWQAALNKEGISTAEAAAQMQQHNPLVIPRNHHVEAVLAATAESQHSDAMTQMLSALRSPYELTKHTAEFQDSSPDADLKYQTFCGT